jgi:hypothetical protein
MNETNNTSWHQWACGAALVAAGMIAGTALRSPSEALGEVRQGPPPQAFQSGGQMSVPVLKEIAATLHQIDGRIARLEIVAQKMQTSNRGTK